MKYEEAIKRLETIREQMEHDELDIDELSDRLKEAQELLAQCRKQLLDVEQQIQKTLEEEQK